MPATVPIEKLNQQHRLHKLYRDCWDDFDLLNAGGVRLKQQAQRFLMKRPKELFDVYNERLKRFTYQQIMGQVVGWYVGALFRRAPSIDLPEGTDGWYAETFLKNCDRGGTSYVDFWKQVFRNLILYKYCFVLTDRPHADVQPADRAQEKEMGLDSPYLVCYDPRQVINWAADDSGNLKWAVIKCEDETQEFLGGVRTVTRWYYFDQEIYRVYEYDDKQLTSAITLFDPSGNRLDLAQASATVIDEGPHALSKIRRVPLRCVAVDDELWLANRMYLQLLDHLNQDNSLAWALFMANLAMPAIFSDKDLGPQTLSETGFLQLGKDDKFEWTEPAGNSFEISQTRLDRLREEIYRTVYLQAQGKSSSASASSQSGYSKEMDMMPANDALNAYGDLLIPGMQNVFGDVAAARGDQKKVSVDVHGFRFETQPLGESVSQYEEFLSAGVFEASPTLERVMLKRLASDAVEDQNDDTKQKIKDEIDKAPMSAEREQLQQQQQIDQFSQSFAKLGDRAIAKNEQAEAQAA